MRGSHEVCDCDILRQASVKADFSCCGRVRPNPLNPPGNGHVLLWNSEQCVFAQSSLVHKPEISLRHPLLGDYDSSYPQFRSCHTYP